MGDNGGNPREIAAYLVAVKGPLGEATSARTSCVQRIGALMEDARHGNPLSITPTAGTLGRQYGEMFRGVRGKLRALYAPAPCRRAHSSLDRWLEKLIATCDLLVSVAHVGDVTRLRQTHGLFAEGRHHAQEFNAEYARLTAAVRHKVAASQEMARLRAEERKTRRRRQLSAA